MDSYTEMEQQGKRRGRSNLGSGVQPISGGGGIFKSAAVEVLRQERRLMTTGEITKCECYHADKQEALGLLSEHELMCPICITVQDCVTKGFPKGAREDTRSDHGVGFVHRREETEWNLYLHQVSFLHPVPSCCVRS
jgi:hypothetical protein